MRTRTIFATSIAAALVGITLVAASAAVGAVDETIKPRATTLAAGSSHTVMIDGVGRVWGVGSGTDGQLGSAGTTASLRMIAGLPAGVTAQAVDAGPDFTLVLGSNGAVYGTGANDSGQLTGVGGADVAGLRPVTGLPSGVRGVAVAAGSDFSLVVGDDGQVYGTGANTHGQLTGTGTRTTLKPLAGLPTGTRAVNADAGDDFTVVVSSDGRVYGTGANESRQLTSGTTADVTSLTPFTGLPSNYRATAVAAGASTTSVLLDDGSALASQPPRGPIVLTTSDGNLITSAQTEFVAVAANPDGAGVLAVGADGEPYGMGANDSSQLTGTGSRTTFTQLTHSGDLDKAVEVAAGPGHTLVRDARGVVYTTGSAAPGLAATTLSLLPQQPLAATDRPTFLTGAAVRAGEELSANEAAGWVPVGVGTSSFQWRRDDVDIPNATGQVYTVAAADYGTTLTVVETRSASSFQAGVRQSEGTVVERPALRAAVAPKISGRATVGSILTASDATFDPQQEDLTRTWRRNGRTIAGATSTSYRLTTADAGTVITVANRGTKPDGAVGELVGTSTSGGVKIALLNRSRPTIKGTAKVGKTLKLKSRGVWHGPSSYTYRWYRGSKAISGATRTSYKLKKADKGKKISLRVSGRRSGFATLVVSSATTKKVKK